MAETTDSLTGQTVTPEIKPPTETTEVVDPISSAPSVNTTNMDVTDSLTVNAPESKVQDAARLEVADSLGLDKEVANVDTPGTTSAIMAPEAYKAPTTTDTTKTAETSASTKPLSKLDTMTDEMKSMVDEGFEQQRQKFIQDTQTQQQAQMDLYSQRLSQSGYNSSGAKNASLAMLTASQGRTLNSGLNALAIKEMETNVAMIGDEIEIQRQLDQDVRSSNINQFYSLEGQPNEQVKMAQMMNEIYPEDPFWSQFENSDYTDTFIRNQSEAARTYQNGIVNDAEALITDNKGSMYRADDANALFPEWKNIMYKDEFQLNTQATSWWESQSLDSINAELEKIGKPTIGDKSDITDYKQISDIFARKEMDDQIKRVLPQQIANFADVILTEMGMDGIVDEEERSLLTNYSSYFSKVLVDNEASLFGVSGNIGGNPNTSDFGFMFTDWFGEPYSGDYSFEGSNKSAIYGDETRPVVNSRLDSLWMSYLRNRDPNTPSLNREEFGQLAFDDANEGNPIHDAVWDSSSDDIMSEGKSDTIIRESLKTVGGLGSESIDGLPDEISAGLTSGNSAESLYTLDNMDAGQLNILMGSEAGMAKLNELTASGEMPSINSIDDELDGADIMRTDSNGNIYMPSILSIGGQLYRTTEDPTDGKTTTYSRIGGGQEEGLTGESSIILEHKQNNLNGFIDDLNLLDQGLRDRFLEYTGGIPGATEELGRARAMDRINGRRRSDEELIKNIMGES